MAQCINSANELLAAPSPTAKQPTPPDIEAERKKFEADAMPYGFSLERATNLTGEPWCDYEDGPTGHRWAGWLACLDPHQVSAPVTIKGGRMHSCDDPLCAVCGHGFEEPTP